MNQRSLAALIVLNLALLAALVVTTLTPTPAQAQFRAGASYLMIAGEVVGRSQQAGVYVFNLSNGQVLPFLYNTSNDRIDTYPVRDVGQDMQRPLSNR